MSDFAIRKQAKALALSGVDHIKQRLGARKIFYRPAEVGMDGMPNLSLNVLPPGLYALHQESQKLQDVDYGSEADFQMSPPNSKWAQAGGKMWDGTPPFTRYYLRNDANILSTAYVFKVPGPVPTAWYIVQICRKNPSGKTRTAAAADQAEEAEEEEDEDNDDGVQMDLVPLTIAVQGKICDDFERMQIELEMLSSGQEIPAPFHAGHELQGDTDEWIKVEKSLEVNNICVRGKICCLSDEATKTNIKVLKLDENFQELVESIIKISIISFDDAMKQSRIGFSANNVQSVLPTCVSTVELVNGNQALTVDAMGILAYLTLTVQGLAKQYQQGIKAILEMLVEDRPLRDVIKYMKVPLLPIDSDGEDETSTNNSGPKQAQRKIGGLSIEQVGKQIARDLNEPNVENLIERIHSIGITASLNLRDELLKNPPNDGRTLGGHFFRKSKSIGKADASKDTLEKSSLYGKARDYQLKAVEDIGDENAILVLPTGFGKTLVACMVVEKTLKKRPGCSLFITQDRELARQQAANFYRDGPPDWRRSGAILVAMGGDDMQKLTKGPKGLVWESCSIQLRTSNWNKITSETTILFITAGALMDTILCPKMQLNGGSSASEPVLLDKIPIVVLDEAHHAGEGSHNFVLALKEFRLRNMKAQLLGLSASPVSGTCDESQLKTRLRDLQSNLWNAKIVVPLELPYAKSLASMTLERVNPLYLEHELIGVVSELVESIKNYCLELGGTGTPMPKAYGENFVEWAHERSVYFARNGDDTRAAAFFALFRIVSSWLLIEDIGAVAANDLVSAILILQVHHSDCDEVLDLILRPFVSEIARILNHPEFHSTKLVTLKTILETESKKTLIRVATRRGVFWLTNYLQSQGFRATALVGRSLMNESKIRQALEGFGRGDIDILVGTSMVEEGIDLQNCDTVIAFSVLRLLNSGKSLIQNAGRARQSGSKLVILCSNLVEELQFRKLIEQVRAMFRVVSM